MGVPLPLPVGWRQICRVCVLLLLLVLFVVVVVVCVQLQPERIGKFVVAVRMSQISNFESLAASKLGSVRWFVRWLLWLAICNLLLQMQVRDTEQQTTLDYYTRITIMLVSLLPLQNNNATPTTTTPTERERETNTKTVAVTWIRWTPQTNRHHYNISRRLPSCKF